MKRRERRLWKQQQEIIVFVLLLGIPIKVMRNSKDKWGSKRLNRFANDLMAEYTRFINGVTSIDEYKELIKTFCEVEIND